MAVAPQGEVARHQASDCNTVCTHQLKQPSARDCMPTCASRSGPAGLCAGVHRRPDPSAGCMGPQQLAQRHCGAMADLKERVRWSDAEWWDRAKGSCPAKPVFKLPRRAQPSVPTANVRACCRQPQILVCLGGRPGHSPVLPRLPPTMGQPAALPAPRPAAGTATRRPPPRATERCEAEGGKDV
jgi:hypothetical protein